MVDCFYLNYEGLVMKKCVIYIILLICVISLLIRNYLYYIYLIFFPIQWSGFIHEYPNDFNCTLGWYFSCCQLSLQQRKCVTIKRIFVFFLQCIIGCGGKWYACASFVRVILRKFNQTLSINISGSIRERPSIAHFIVCLLAAWWCGTIRWWWWWFSADDPRALSKNRLNWIDASTHTTHSPERGVPSTLFYVCVCVCG